MVKVTVGKSQTLYSSLTKRGRDRNSGFFSIGPVNVEIPQHPIVLHVMMTRSSKQLSSTLQELRVGRNSVRVNVNANRNQNIDEPDSPFHHGRSSGSGQDLKEKVQQQQSQQQQHQQQQQSQLNINQQQEYYNQQQHNQQMPPTTSTHSHRKLNISSTTAVGGSINQQNGLLQPLVMQFNVLLQSLSINAALLPSLQAQYRMNQVSSSGVSGSRAKFVIDLPTHTLSFNTKIQVKIVVIMI